MLNEKTTTDQFVRRQIEALGVTYDEQGSSIVEIKQALSKASKSGPGRGMPEFIFLSKDFVVVVEDKLDNEKNAKIIDGQLAIDSDGIANYALNGAVHYAKHIVENSSFTRVFAIGITGSERRHVVRPAFVSPEGAVVLDALETLENFRPENIQRFYEIEVLGKTPVEQIELREIIDIAKQFHEDLRNYGQLSEQEKPLVVSAVLLALEDENFNRESLIGNQVETDGEKIFKALSNYLEVVEVAPGVKKDMILDKFAFIKNRVKINRIDANLGKTPMKFFTDFVAERVLGTIRSNVPEDVLGRFYGEFVSYTGGDGKGLGIVLTPRHITELMCELVEVGPSDIVLDPCAGTAGFLISAMHRMMKGLTDSAQIDDIKKNKLHGIEIREDLFTIATTNMILRGDGKSNLRCADFTTENIQSLRKIGATVGLMNPPYAQAKSDDTAHLSELNFVLRLLDSLKPGARCAVIVPQSTMIGKTKRDRENKKVLLENHTLEAVLTLNKDTFYRIGTNPCIAVFTARRPHNPKKRVKFINFEDDGYVVNKHIGLVATELAKDRKRYLLDVYFDRVEAPSRFMVKATVKSTDEWLHGFYYFNDEPPTFDEFERAMAQYLVFEFDMKVQGKDYLFPDGEKNGNAK